MLALDDEQAGYLLGPDFDEVVSKLGTLLSKTKLPFALGQDAPARIVALSKVSRFDLVNNFTQGALHDCGIFSTVGPGGSAPTIVIFQSIYRRQHRLPSLGAGR